MNLKRLIIALLVVAGMGLVFTYLEWAPPLAQWIDGKEFVPSSEERIIKTPSPDGNYIAVTKVTAGAGKIYIADKSEKQITPEFCGAISGWYPDNQRVRVKITPNCPYDRTQGGYVLTIQGLTTGLLNDTPIQVKPGTPPEPDPYVPLPINLRQIGESHIKENISPNGKYISHNYSDEQGDSGIWITDANNHVLTKTYCGFFREWAGDQVKVYVPGECGHGVKENELFWLNVSGSVQVITGQ